MLVSCDVPCHSQLIYNTYYLGSHSSLIESFVCREQVGVTQERDAEFSSYHIL